MRTVKRGLGERFLLLCFLLLMPGATSLGAPIISELLSSNSAGLADEDGAFSDWVEIHNPGAAPVSLAGCYLTDDALDLRRWQFPVVTLPPGGYLVVFASGKNRLDPARPLHTNFQLSSAGEYLALVAADGVTVISSVAPAYPPQFENESFGVDVSSSPPTWQFYPKPTPGSPNGSGTRAGPVVSAVEANPPRPVTGSLTVSARVRPVNGSVASVTIYYRRGFAAESPLPMTDDGAGGDAVAGDGVWTAVLPAVALAAGELTRWRFTANDQGGAVTREPAYRDPLNSPQYFGTVAQDPELRSLLPVLHWFTSNPAAAGTAAGSRGAVYYEGEFYDNVLFSLHGQSSAGFPKKSYNLDFTRSQRFRWSTNAPRVADIDLLTNWADKAKTRHVLGYEVMRESGVAAHFAFTVRVEQNGAFFSTADLVEDADEIYLERAGLNPDGALYKVYQNLLNRDSGDNATNGVEKKTRRGENNSDLQALINGLDLTGPALDRYLYDHIDLPRCINMLAANSVIRNIDMHSKNWYIYCDTGRSGEWAILPWDLDLSHGRVWNTQNTYFDNALYTDGFVVTGTSIRLVAHLFANPATRAMILRRIRTLSDRFLQPPPAAGTPESSLYYERRLNEQAALMDPPTIVPSDARLDFEKWGSWLQGGAQVRYTNANAAVETMAEAITRFKTEYLPARRRYIYNTQVVGRGGEIPPAQSGADPVTNFTALVVSGAPARILVPAGPGLGSNWTGNPAHEPFADSGWKAGATGVGYERATGYESILATDVYALTRSNNSVYIRIAFNVSNPAAFDRLQLRMKFDDGFAAFLNGTLLASANAPEPLAWNSAATISREANPAAFTLFDVSDKIGSLRAGRNVLAIQGLNDSLASSDLIIVPELHGGKATVSTTLEPQINFGSIEFNPASGNQDQEFIQLLNPNQLAVDISGWRLAGGVEHTFAPGTVLPPEGALFVCPDSAAFRARTVSPKGGEGRFVQGGYRGHLSSLGETLVLLDGSGATNNVTSYPGQPSDLQRYLVVSELMYHPAGDGLAEFIELFNTSSTIELSLRGVRFTEGIEFDFTSGAVTGLPPHGRVLVVRDRAAFAVAYGTNLPVAGVFANGSALNNTGERLKLEDPDDATIREFTYDDRAPWPTDADAGWSLVLVAPETIPDHALASSWRASSRRGGNPGGPDGSRFPANPAGDVDGNGEPDLLDYALGNDLGLSPVQPRVEVSPGAAGEPSSLRLTYPVSLEATDVALSVVYSTDLENWLDGGAHLELLSRQPLDEGRELFTWLVKPPLRDGPQVFLRLRATGR